MNPSGRGRRRNRTVPTAAAGSAAQRVVMNQEVDGSSQNAVQPEVPPIQPQLVASVTEQVLQALSREEKRGTKRSKGQKNSKHKKPRTPRSSGTDFDDSDESLDDSDSDSSSSSESDSDDCKLLSDPTTSLIDLKLKNKIWQNKYVDFFKLLRRDDLTSDKSLRLQSAGNSEYKFVASKPKESIKTIGQWTTALLNFFAVYSEKYLKQIQAVIKHGEIV
ncbi:uncharacterized protein LOC133188132 [Saccostrea echinata]|uniref:uncharacterized protein LOC133188132 n=1 Tax=Saccostrea echinata TaxID=191078 RepID=UPI002A7F4218|nr:uncharacterized protein LOC133188132 [Saccostrea echinata]